MNSAVASLKGRHRLTRATLREIEIWARSTVAMSIGIALRSSGSCRVRAPVSIAPDNFGKPPTRKISERQVLRFSNEGPRQSEHPNDFPFKKGLAEPREIPIAGQMAHRLPTL